MTMQKSLPLALVFFGLVLAIGSGFAGDYAERRIIGFSDQGRHFAFEQFGRQDGSGFAYAEIIIIDIEADDWVAGTPVRVLLRDESAGIADARAKAAEQAAGTLKQLGIRHPGELLASNPPAEIGRDPLNVSVNARFPLPGETQELSFSLQQFPLSAASCAGFSDQPIKGFRLQMTKDAAKPLILHEDTSIPKSRHCPLGYAISDVARFAAPNRSITYALLVSVLRVGFEGPDRRFIAVTAKSP